MFFEDYKGILLLFGVSEKPDQPGKRMMTKEILK